MYDDYPQLKDKIAAVLRAAYQKSGGTGSIVTLKQVNEDTPITAADFKQVLAVAVANNHAFAVMAQDCIFLTPQGREYAKALVDEGETDAGK
jgi:hypothetical protein